MPPLTPIVRTPIIDDDGTLTKGTVFENAWKTEFYNQIDNALQAAEGNAFKVTSRYDVGTQHNYAFARGRHTYVEWGAGAGQALIITGIGGGVAGDVITFKNASPTRDVIHLFHQHGGSLAGNRLWLVPTSTTAPTPVAFGGSVTLVYGPITSVGSNQWVVIAHDQGAWLSPPFSAAAFAASGGGGGTWVLDAADVVAQSYHLRGKTLRYQFVIGATTITGTPAQLQILNANFGGFQIGNNYHRIGWHNIAGQDVMVFGGTDRIVLSLLGGGNFGALTNAAYFYGTWSGEVT